MQISDAEAVPANFYRQPPPEIDKQAVKDALKAGEDVPGAYLEAGERVVIK
ncbi:siphovirus Gp157 family protein [Alkalilimnicola ehrlichii]|uniref:siphovirus Gp157 family protein n=1 Tax=Alkalilimnicola ehrlichii TaxID=351052 RepID=UPI00384C438C